MKDILRSHFKTSMDYYPDRTLSSMWLDKIILNLYYTIHLRIDDNIFLIKKLTFMDVEKLWLSSCQWFPGLNVPCTCIWDSEASNFKDISTHSSQYLFYDVKTLIPYPLQSYFFQKHQINFYEGKERTWLKAGEVNWCYCFCDTALFYKVW